MKRSYLPIMIIVLTVFILLLVRLAFVTAKSAKKRKGRQGGKLCGPLRSLAPFAVKEVNEAPKFFYWLSGPQGRSGLPVRKQVPLKKATCTPWLLVTVIR